MAPHRFMVYAPDYTDDGAQGRRPAVREKHLADAQKSKDEGKLGESI